MARKQEGSGPPPVRQGVTLGTVLTLFGMFGAFLIFVLGLGFSLLQSLDTRVRGEIQSLDTKLETKVDQDTLTREVHQQLIQTMEDLQEVQFTILCQELKGTYKPSDETCDLGDGRAIEYQRIRSMVGAGTPQP